MVDAFDDFLDEHLATHMNGSKQIDLISISQGLVSYINEAFILDPKTGAGSHSYIGIDLDFRQQTSLTLIPPPTAPNPHLNQCQSNAILLGMSQTEEHLENVLPLVQHTIFCMDNYDH